MDAGRSGARRAWPDGQFSEPSGIPWDGASFTLQRVVYARVGDVVAVVEALRVDAEQDFDAVPGPLGDPWRGHPGRQPERYGRVAQVIGTSGQG